MFSLIVVRDCQSKLYLLPNYSPEEMLLAVCVAVESILTYFKKKYRKKNAVNAQLKNSIIRWKEIIQGELCNLKGYILFHLNFYIIRK